MSYLITPPETLIMVDNINNDACSIVIRKTKRKSSYTFYVNGDDIPLMLTQAILLHPAQNVYFWITGGRHGERTRRWNVRNSNNVFESCLISSL